MSEKKDINRLFQERFKDFEAAPPDAVWDRIEKELPPQKKKRRAAWIFYSGIAAGFALLFSLIYFVSTTENTSFDSQFVSEEKTSSEQTEIDALPASRENTDASGVVNQDLSTVNPTAGKSSAGKNISKNNTGSLLDENRSRSLKNTYKDASVASSPSVEKSQKDSRNTVSNTNQATISKNTSKTNPLTRVKRPAVNNSMITQQKGEYSSSSSRTNGQMNPIIKGQPSDTQWKKQTSNNLKTDIAAINDPQKEMEQPQDSLSNPLIQDAIAQQELEKESDTLDFNSLGKARFQGSTLIAPIYSNATGSAINNSVANNERSAGYNLSYGVALGYELNDRWTVRAGVHKIDVSYNTQDVVYGGSAPFAPVSGMFNHNDVASASPGASNGFIGTFSQELVNNSFKGFNGELSQQIGYIEVPLEVRYRLTNSRLRLSMTGGFSALFLQENSVNITSNNQRLELGSDDNFREFNQSANFGIGIDYGISKNLGFMIEPMFKYQLNALERNTAGFRPYTIGVYSGLTFMF
jgi:hypothetical protein